MLAREVLSIVVMTLETCDNPAYLLSSPLAHLGIEVLVGPLVALASDPGTARYTTCWAMMWVFDLVVGLWWLLDWVWTATALGFLGALATETQPAWLTITHAGGHHVL
jgi:hypothetical protein